MKLWSLALAAALLPAAVSAQTLRWSSQGDSATMDPYAHTESFTANMQHHIYDPLVRRNRKLEIEPALATSWSLVAPDRWRFVLRQGVTFQGGEPFSADDVVASVARLLDPAARAKGNLPNVVRVEKVDAHTVDFVMSGPYPLLLNDLSGIFIMSAAWLKAHDALKPGNVSTGATTYASTNANGTGPFRLDSFQPDAKTVLVVNEAWWDKPEHNLKRIEFRPIRSDATRVAALQSGEIDLIAPAPLQDLARIAAAPGFKVVEDPSLRLIFLGLNWRPTLVGQAEPNPLLNLKVRQALWHGVDLEAIRMRVMRGKSRTTGTLVAPPVPGYDAALDRPLPYDPALAKRKLAEAGYPNGFKVGLACPNDRYIADEQICVAIAAMWTRLGIAVDLRTESKATYFGRSDKGETDIYMLGWATLPPMDAYSVLSAILATRKGSAGGNNPNGLSDPRLDDLALRAGAELDEAKRRGLMVDALRIAHDEAIFIPLHLQPVAWAMRDTLDVPQFADEYVRLWFARMK